MLTLKVLMFQASIVLDMSEGLRAFSDGALHWCAGENFEVHCC